jgi:geranylgeranyl diphosphate synthase type I
MPTLAAGVPEVLTRHLPAIEVSLRAAITSENSELVSAARYVMGWEDASGASTRNEGKRIRPALCLFGAEAVGGSATDAMPGAVAVELIHNFSLVHDEVQDRDAERHHRPTAWRIFGEGQAINLGDYLYSRAFAALLGGQGKADRQIAAFNVLNRAVSRMIAGQWEDIAFETRDDVTVEEYLAMSAGKTGALLGAPLEMGALLAGGNAETAATLGRWGAEVGLAFQAWDDYLGTWGDSDETGKSTTNDIARKKKTLPVVYGLAHPAAARVIRGAYTLPALGEREIEAVASTLREIGADELCRRAASQHAEAADALLASLTLPADVREHFRAVGGYFYQRGA